jgi:hypothetical protein
MLGAMVVPSLAGWYLLRRGTLRLTVVDEPQPAQYPGGTASGWQRLVGLFFDPVGSAEALSRSPSRMGFVVGVLGACAFPMTSLIGRFQSGTLRENEIDFMVFEQIPAAAISFLLGCIATVLAARILGGRGSLLEFARLSGWSGMFPIVWSLLVLPAILIGPMLPKNAGVANNALLLPIILPLWAAAISLVPWVRFQVATIRKVFGLSRARSVATFAVLLGPLFALYDWLV